MAKEDEWLINSRARYALERVTRTSGSLSERELLEALGKMGMLNVAALLRVPWVARKSAAQIVAAAEKHGLEVDKKTRQHEYVLPAV